MFNIYKNGCFMEQSHNLQSPMIVYVRAIVADIYETVYPYPITWLDTASYLSRFLFEVLAKALENVITSIYTPSAKDTSQLPNDNTFQLPNDTMTCNMTDRLSSDFIQLTEKYCNKNLPARDIVAIFSNVTLIESQMNQYVNAVHDAVISQYNMDIMRVQIDELQSGIKLDLDLDLDFDHEYWSANMFEIDNLGYDEMLIPVVTCKSNGCGLVLKFDHVLRANIDNVILEKQHAVSCDESYVEIMYGLLTDVIFADDVSYLCDILDLRFDVSTSPAC